MQIFMQKDSKERDTKKNGKGEECLKNMNMPMTYRLAYGKHKPLPFQVLPTLETLSHKQKFQFSHTHGHHPSCSVLGSGPCTALGMSCRCLGVCSLSFPIKWHSFSHFTNIFMNITTVVWHRLPCTISTEGNWRTNQCHFYGEE